MKISRNALCPCGSGRKYKKCRLPKDAQRAYAARMITLPEEVRLALLEKQRCETERIHKYGSVPAPVTAMFQGQQFVAVGARLLSDKMWNTTWKTFHDFLFCYPGAVFEKEWFQAELGKPLTQRHPLMQWYNIHRECDATYRSPEQKGKIIGIARPPALISALLSLTYELYLLENRGLLSARLIKRLQNSDQFQGARYETYVIASFIRAGFTVILEDESDVTSSHSEFTAVYKATGHAYSVEAKSRHRAGFLGQRGDPRPLEEIKGDVRRLLTEALRKAATHDRIVFVDVNVPPADTSIFKADWFNRVATQMEELEEDPRGPAFPSAFVFLTTFPYHFVGDEPLRGATVQFRGFNIPEFRAGHPDAHLIPTKYPEMFALSNSLCRHTQVPRDLT